MIHSVPREYHDQRPGRRLWLLLVLCMLSGGCRGPAHWKSSERRTAKIDAAEAACAGGVLPLRRRVLILDQSGGHGAFLQGNFCLELAATLNSQPGWEAVLLPPAQTEAICAGNWQPIGPEVIPAEGIAIEPTWDQVLVVQITEISPYRPIRISAVLERRDAVDGTVISRENRSWHAPIDDEPLWPSHVNQMILSHPPPLDLIEQHELARISPLAFVRNVAAEIALEYSERPF